MNYISARWSDPVYISMFLTWDSLRRPAGRLPRFPVDLVYFGSNDKTQLRARIIEDEIYDQIPKL